MQPITVSSISGKRMQCAIAALLCCCLFPGTVLADIYIASDSPGEIYLTNIVESGTVESGSTLPGTVKPGVVDTGITAYGPAAYGKAAPKPVYGNYHFKVLVADEKTALAGAAMPRPDSQALPFSQAVSLAAATTSLEPALLHAVMMVESNNNPMAVSRRGARGLMQLMPATAKRYAVTNPHDPGQNIAAGAQYLQALQHRFNGDTRLALAAYNAGPTAVIKAGFRIPPFSETQQYVPRVMQLYQNLQNGEALIK